MEDIFIQSEDLPVEQFIWLMKFDPIFKLAQNYDKKYLEKLIDDIEREASAKGYFEIIDLINKEC